MKKYPKLRCPVCGMVVWLKNMLGFHSVEAYEYTFGIGRGKIRIDKPKIKGNLYQYWIDRLQEVIDWLKKEQMARHPSLVLSLNQNKVSLSTVSAKSVSVMTTLTSPLTVRKTLSVPNSQISILWKGKK